MKKRDVIDLIRCHVDKNDLGFRNIAYKIAKEFSESGDVALAEYISTLLSNASVLVPQGIVCEEIAPYFEKVSNQEPLLLLPEELINGLKGVANAIGHNVGIHRFLFHGAPGTGKTEAVKQLAKMLNREVFSVNFTDIIDSKLGQTQKNLTELFMSIRRFPRVEQILILFDEIDAIALNRTDEHDLREMGRVTSHLLKMLDQLEDKVIVVATTNLYSHLDKALVRRFDSVINFDCYTNKDLIEIAERLLEYFLQQMNLIGRDRRLFRKIIELAKPIPMPGELKNIIRTSLAFSDSNDKWDYFRKLYFYVYGKQPNNLFVLKNQGFTVREIEKLTNLSRSTVSRKLQGDNKYA